MSNKFNILVGIIIAAVTCFFKFYTINDYGVVRHSYDEYIRGEAYLHFFLTGSKDYSDVPDDERCFYQKTTLKEAIETDFFALNYLVADYKKDFMQCDLTGPIGGIISALGCYIFHQKLGLMGVINAHHAMFIILSTLTIFIIFLVALEVYGVKVAALSAIFMALFPRLAGHMQNYYREIPIVCFGIFSIWLFWKGTKKQDWKLILLSSIFWGLGLANKLTALFIPITFIPWVCYLAWKKREFFEKKFWIALLIYPFTAGLVVFLVWPFLWYNTFSHLKAMFVIYRNAGLANLKWRPYYVPFYTLITTPLHLIFLGIIGTYIAVKNIKDEEYKTSFLIISWCFGTLLVFTIPKAAIRGGIRYFLLFVPAFCVLAGLGAIKIYDLTVEFLKKYGKNIAISGGIGIQSLFIVFSLYPVIKTHPYQVVYFNSLIGGLYGAKTVKIPFVPGTPGIPGAIDYWGNPYNSPSMTGIPYAYDIYFTSYRRAFRWLNKNAEHDSLILAWTQMKPAQWDSKQTRGIWPELRQDLQLRELRWIKNLEQINTIEHNHCYIVYLPDKVLITGWSPVVQYCLKNLKPIYSEESQGAPVFLIYKYS